MAPRSRRTIHRRSLHAHRAGEFLSAECDGSQNARRSRVRRYGKDRYRESGSGAMARALAGCREKRPRESAAGRTRGNWWPTRVCTGLRRRGRTAPRNSRRASGFGSLWELALGWGAPSRSGQRCEPPRLGPWLTAYSLRAPARKPRPVAAPGKRSWCWSAHPLALLWCSPLPIANRRHSSNRKPVRRSRWHDRYCS